MRMLCEHDEQQAAAMDTSAHAELLCGRGTELGFRGQVNYLPSMPLSGDRTNQPDVHWLPTPSIVNCFRLFRFLSDPRHELADESIRVEFKIAAESTSRLAQDATRGKAPVSPVGRLVLAVTARQ